MRVKIVLLLTIFVLSGCGSMTKYTYREITDVPPDLRRVVLINDTNLYLSEGGIFGQMIGPREVAETNLPYNGTYKGVIVAYQKEGMYKGEPNLQPCWSMEYRMRADSSNRVLRQLKNLSVDDHKIIRKTRCQPNKSPGIRTQINIVVGR